MGQKKLRIQMFPVAIITWNAIEKERNVSNVLLNKCPSVGHISLEVPEPI